MTTFAALVTAIVAAHKAGREAKAAGAPDACPPEHAAHIDAWQAGFSGRAYDTSLVRVR